MREFLPLDQISFHDDAARMLQEHKPDLVCVTTKHDQHAPLTILAARAGAKGVICEKPIAMDLAQADAALDACRRHGTKLAIGHQRRFDLEWEAGRKLISDGLIGKVLLAVSRWPDANPQYRFDLIGGGPLMWLSVHSLDLLRYCLGDIAWVTAQVDMANPQVDTETRAYAFMQFRNGAHAVLDSGQGIGPEASLGHSIVFYGEQGTVHVADGYGTRYKTRDEPRWREVPLPKEDLPWPRRAHLSCGKALRDLIHCIEHGGQPRCSGEEGRADLEAIMAMYESERTGGRVMLPLTSGPSPLALMNQQGGFGAITWRRPA